MRTHKWLLGIALAACTSVNAQSTLNDIVVAATAKVQASPPKITLSWPSSSDAVQFAVYRKLKSDAGFGTALATLAGTSTGYTDNAVSAGQNYDYLVRKATSAYQAFGELSAGIALPITEHRGAILLVMDSALFPALTASVDQFKLDLTGDGWVVYTQNVAANMSVPAVKAKISAWYNKDKVNNKAVFLVGHIPVPYSGLMDASGSEYPPDGHPEHGGAWPTDLYYAEMDGNWTDAGTKVPAGSRTANQNNPGDGKFDQHNLPSDVDLQIGRIDMYDMPIFGSTETDLLKQYFKKDHQYRQCLISVSRRGIISDNLGVFNGEAPGRGGLMNFVPLFSNAGSEDVVPGKYFDTLLKKDYLFSLASSTAGYTNINGIGGVDRYKDSILSVFNMSFGSYHADWDNTNNMLRGCLGSKGFTLTNVWSGRPEWHFLHMGMGENIGYSALVTQNNQGYYYAGAAPYRIHINLMGDPTLRLHMIKPVTGLSSVTVNSNKDVKLTWTASADSNIIGYHIFRCKKISGPYERITVDPVNAVTYTDTKAYAGENNYMVRAVRLEQTPTGTYYNMSQGVFSSQASVSGTNTGIADLGQSETLVAYPNPASSEVSVILPKVAGNCSISLSDMSGRQVFKASTGTDAPVYQLNVAGFERGFYLLQLQSEGRTWTQKIILQ